VESVKKRRALSIRQPFAEMIMARKKRFEYRSVGSPIYELEVSARLRGVELWRDADPMPPWEWRKGARNARIPLAK
jgi:hypothetical protein